MLVSVSGLINSGKDTIAGYLTTRYQFKKVSFASSLKDSIAVIFNWDRELLEGSTKSSREWREQVDQWWSERLNIPNLTPRWILQYWGTDVCRKHFHDDIWIASLENKLRYSSDNIVITDCRFTNELNAIKRINGLTLRVHRGPKPVWYDYAVAFNKGNIDAEDKLKSFNIHASEYSGVGLEYDYHIDNDSTIDDLYRKVDSIINL